MRVSDEFNVGVGAAVKAARKRAKVSQESLASAVKLSRTSISNIEVGRQKLLLEGFCRIASALHIDPGTLLEDALARVKAEKTHTVVDLNAQAIGRLGKLSSEELEIIHKMVGLSTDGGYSDEK